jgi:hypothetical protein
VIVRRVALVSDAAVLAPRLRAADLAEIAAGTGRPPFEVLVSGVEAGCEAAVIDGRVEALYGCAGGVPWLLGSDTLSRHPWALLRPGRALVAEWLRMYGWLRNYVHAEHRESLRWLAWLGFTVEEPRPVGVRGEMFHLFWMRADVQP